MKKYYIFCTLALGSLSLASCSMDDIYPEGGVQTDSQVQQTVTAAPERIKADVYGLYDIIGRQFVVLGRDFHCDFGYPAMCLSQDSNGPDMVCDDSGFNWFNPSYDLTDRNTNYAVAAFRYGNPYNLIKLCNDIIKTVDVGTATGDVLLFYAQAKAMRAFAYWGIAPYYQFNYIDNPDAPCIPLVSEKTTDFNNNPRATNKAIYTLMYDDLTDAIKYLEGYQRNGTSKIEVDQQVAYGLRARVNLAMGNYEEAASDAAKAADGYTPASIQEVSKPSFCLISEHNWIWGININKANLGNLIANIASMLSSFSGYGYATATGVYKRINPLLWNKIGEKDVRKGWWVDDELKSPLLDNITWNGKTGVDIATMKIPNSKLAFLPYTNVKFGMKGNFGSTFNDNDWPLMRVEEMILIQVEGLAKSGHESEAAKLLQDFVSTYRNPAYVCNKTGQELYDEIWKERRVELWGEGFSMFDVLRLNKPIVRIHGTNFLNWPDKFAFNMKADDPYLLLRFPESETNTNAGVSTTENVAGDAPKSGQNSDLRDGVTD